MGSLTFEEAAIIKIYRRNSRRETIAAMVETWEYLEPEMREMLDHLIEKLEVMTDDEFARLNLSTPFDEENDGGG